MRTIPGPTSGLPGKNCVAGKITGTFTATGRLSWSSHPGAGDRLCGCAVIAGIFCGVCLQPVLLL